MPVTKLSIIADLLRTKPLRHPRPALRNAPPPLRHHKRHPARGRSHLALDHGPLRPPTPPAHRRGSDVRVPPDHRRAGRQVRRAVGRPLHRRLGRRGLPVLLHVQLRGYMGARALGYAFRNFSEQPEGKGRGVEHV
jgi:hypothetical protein